MEDSNRTDSLRRPFHVGPIRVAAFLIFLLALCGAACQSRPATEDRGQRAEGRAQSAEGRERTAATRPAGHREVWEVATIQGVRVGYGRTTIRRTVRDGQDLLSIEGATRLAMRRFDTPITMDIRFASTETPEGRLLVCESVIAQGSTTMATTGRVIGDKLQLQVTTSGKTTTAAVPWSSEYGGYYALQQSLSRSPMKPGQTRTIRGLEPGTAQVSTTRLTARNMEPVKLLDRTAELLRIDSTTTLDGQTIPGSLWTDGDGEILKSRTDMLAIEMFRTTKEEALKASEPGKLDLAASLAIPVNRVLERPHATKRVRYRMHLDGGNPAGVFASGPSQKVQPIDPHTAEVTVFALRLGQPAGNPGAKEDPPTAADREPNNWIQSDHPKIVAAAKEAVGDLKDPWQVAVALERYAHGRIRRPGFSQAFDTALDVLESGEGDCTEHAVLLAALARARGIPARVAIGLVYYKQTFLYHMWTEMYLEGRWIPMDATLAQGGIGAAHLKLVHTSLQGASALSSFLPVAQVAGRLKIEIMEAE